AGAHAPLFYLPTPRLSASRSQAYDAGVNIAPQDSRSNGSFPSQGNVDEIDAGLLLEQLHRKVAAGSGAGSAESELTRFFFGIGDQLLEGLPGTVCFHDHDRGCV